jgi:hypothetical protein
MGHTTSAAVVAALVLVWGGPAAAAVADTPNGPRPALHETTAPSPGHDMSDMTDEEMANMGGDGSDGSTDPGSSTTRTAVLTGFAAVNVGVLGSALLLRRHDRRHPRHPARAGLSPR